MTAYAVIRPDGRRGWIVASCWHLQSRAQRAARAANNDYLRTHKDRAGQQPYTVRQVSEWLLAGSRVYEGDNQA